MRLGWPRLTGWAWTYSRRAEKRRSRDASLPGPRCDGRGQPYPGGRGHVRDPVVSLLRAAKCRLGAGEVALVLAQKGQVEGAVSVAGVGGALVGRGCRRELALVLERHAQVACGRSMAPLVGATEGRGRSCRVSLLLEQHAEVVGPVGVAAPVCARVGSLRAGELARSFEQDAEVARSGRVALIVRLPIGRDGTADSPSSSSRSPRWNAAMRA